MTEPTCCRKHWEEYTGKKTLTLRGLAVLNPFGMPFIVCGTCGNKRCPKATNCDLDCTGSNAANQQGSVYS